MRKLNGGIKQWAVLLTMALSSVSFFAQAKTTVFAAASMTNTLEQIATEYGKHYPNQDIVFSFASSSALARQIIQGAPADIFISADQQWMNFLAEKGAIEADSRKNIAGNALVMIAPKESHIEALDLTDDKWQSALNGAFLAVGDPAYVPAGIYAKAAFTYLNQWDSLQKKLARTDNVRKALLLVKKGEVPLGVVYQTDAMISADNVKIVAVFPEKSHMPVEYPAAIVKGRERAETRDFFDYLHSEPAKAIFRQNGFTIK
ncbi:molybdate ABC transporter periplasmic protein ModA [[Pasteurella] mairii]|uniref:Molybdate ABC transporter periplasmic protein ModA n=1 Tax=[Pasteurella] mairii TaxID=757 RepID=A0A379B323_9PAST|nr:molybdate ABC transporter periplasmic protein ModA [[Pasteurella] mairii]